MDSSRRRAPPELLHLLLQRYGLSVTFSVIAVITTAGA
ncbi:hypothetical protein ACNUDN_00134 [Mycobacterium sp. smrl_JER01]